MGCFVNWPPCFVCGFRHSHKKFNEVYKISQFQNICILSNINGHVRSILHDFWRLEFYSGNLIEKSYNLVLNFANKSYNIFHEALFLTGVM